ncbi:MAG: response regulator [Myxococcales bacterium]|nr:response regulator [Myxococcales bacterium]
MMLDDRSRCTKVQNDPPPVPDLDVLVADDDAVLLQALRRQLTSLGYRVVAAPGGREAIEALSTRPFDVVVCDLVMPGCDGLEVQAAAQVCQPPPAFILLSGDPDRDDVLETFRNGAADVLIKPASVIQLQRALRQAADGRKGKVGRPPGRRRSSRSRRRSARPSCPGPRRGAAAVEHAGAPEQVSPRALEAVLASDATLALHALRGAGVSGGDLRAAIGRLGVRRALSTVVAAARPRGAAVDRRRQRAVAEPPADRHADGAAGGRAPRRRRGLAHTDTLLRLAGEAAAWRLAREGAAGLHPAPAVARGIGAAWPQLGATFLDRWLPGHADARPTDAADVDGLTHLARHAVGTRIPGPSTDKDAPLPPAASSWAARVGAPALDRAVRAALAEVKALLDGGRAD